MAAVPKTKRKQTSLSTAPKVYSYIRFSTPEQAEGDSERRQVEKAKLWAEKHGYTLDESLRADRGVPSYHGANRTKGNLGKFLQRVQAGDVPRGSILAVEELRRLTREGLYVSLKEIFEKLWDADVTIQTLQPEYTYTRETCDNDLATSVTLTLLLQLAREESRQKSEWGNSAWKHKRDDARAQGKMLTSMAPDWLQKVVGPDRRKKLVLGKDEKPIVVPEAAKAIIIAYQLREKGLGAGPIARHLNAKSPWMPPAKKKKGGKPGEMTSGWNASYVKKILMSRAVIGEYQPCTKKNGKRVTAGDVIPDYYPNLFAKPAHAGLFEAVQTINKANAGKCKGGRNDKANNVLQKLVKCAYCGGSMHFQDKGNGWRYLTCSNGLDGKTDCKEKYSSIKYLECQTAVIDSCTRLRIEEILPKKSDQSKLCQSLRQRLERASAVVQSIQDKIDGVKEQIKVPGLKPERRAEYESWRDEYDLEMTEAKTELLSLERELQNAEQSEKTFLERQANIKALKKAIEGNDEKAIEARQRLNAELRELIDQIEIFTDGHQHRYNGEGNDGDTFYEDLTAGLEESGAKLSRREQQEFDQFSDWVIRQRMTKKGRFLRVHFKMSAVRREQHRERFGSASKGYIDVVPADSIAGRNADPETLWGQFNSKKNRGVR